MPPQEERARDAKVAGADNTAYLAKLGSLGRDLEALARSANAAAIRFVRQRLVEWIEDVRSVGGHTELWTAVEQLVKQLSAALATGANLEAEALAVAAVLATLAAGGTPPKPSRQAFWK
jgi:hypothetical protein